MRCPLSQTIVRFLVPGLLLLAGIPAVSRADVWDANSDFVASGTVNPNGVWTYGLTVGLGGPFTAFTNYETIGLGAFWDMNPGIITNPSLWRNGSGAAAFGVPNGSLSLHPGAVFQAVLRFTAPAAGWHDFQLDYGAGDSGTVDLHVLLNGAAGSPLYVELEDTGGGAWSSGAPVLLNPGDTVDFIVGASVDSGDSDNTPFNFVVTTSAVPEPGILGLAGLLATALPGRVRRRE